MEHIDHIDFHIAYRCVNNCIFCSSSTSIDKFKNHSLAYEEIIRILKEKRGDFKSINFTGGEPSILRFLLRLVKQAKALGYKIYLGTNGAGFVDKIFCSKIAPFIDEIRFSIHGHTKELHNFHTKNIKSFDNLNRALENFSGTHVSLFSNTVISKYNFPYLQEILAYLALKKIKHALMSNIAPEGRGVKNYNELVVRLKDIEKKVSQLVKLADREGIILRFFGMPACTLGNYATYSNDFFWDARLNIEQVKENGKFFLCEEKAYLPDRGRMKTQKCETCFYKNICGGIFKIYYNIFKDRELQPIKDENK